MRKSITRLVNYVDALSADVRQIFSRIFSLDIVKGELDIPPQMIPWVEQQFGSVDVVTGQTIIKITNRVTGESSIFNPLRALRPHNFKHDNMPLDGSVKQIEDYQFALPLKNTPQDPFGRIKGKYCITAGNIAKYEQYHNVIIFDNPDPLDFGCSQVADYIETAWKWAQMAHEHDPDARYCLFLWNCSNRAGASIPHGHAQVVLSRGSHYAKVEQLHSAVNEYVKKYKTSYFDDLFLVHRELGLAWKHEKVAIIVYLTPLKLNEVMVLSPSLSQIFADSVYRVLSSFRDKLKVASFNVGIAFPPIDGVTGWSGFPVIARMVDRGSSDNVSSDIGAMEFYGANVVHSDPFQTAAALSTYFELNNQRGGYK